MATPAQRKAIKKHLSTLEDIKVRVPIGKRDEYKAHAVRKGIRLTGKKGSLNALVVEFLENDMKAEAEALGISLDDYRHSLTAKDNSK